jgi:hypothetical protein
MVSSVDATLVQQHEAGFITLSGQAFVNADVNGDARVSSVDYQLILQFTGGLTDTFPAC